MKKILFLLTLTALISCGSDNDDDNDLVNEQLPQEEEVTNFSTRINDRLLIAGQRCEGGENVLDANGQQATCERDQWLITLDNVNTCTAGGACTEVGVVPFIAELDREDRVSVPEYTFFEIDPLSAVTTDQENTIDDYLVRFDINDEEATVISK